MTSKVALAFAAIKQDFKTFWDTVVLPFERKEVKTVEFALENAQKELAPIEEGVLKAIGGAAISAMATASAGVVPETLAAGLSLVEVGAKAALAEAEKQSQPLTHQAATVLAASLNVPTPVVVVPNGANG